MSHPIPLAYCKCGRRTNKKYAREHDGKCKTCVTGKEQPHKPTKGERLAEQRNARILEHGYDAYAREEGHY